MIVENIPWNIYVWNVKFDESLSLSSERFIDFCFGIDAMQNVQSIFHYSLVTQMAD